MTLENPSGEQDAAARADASACKRLHVAISKQTGHKTRQRRKKSSQTAARKLHTHLAAGGGRPREEVGEQQVRGQHFRVAEVARHHRLSENRQTVESTQLRLVRLWTTARGIAQEHGGNSDGNGDNRELHGRFCSGTGAGRAATEGAEEFNQN